MTFSELRHKEVINICDGRRLGCICDIVLSHDGCHVDAIVVPGSLNLRALFKLTKNVIIPWNKIRKLGDDVILVDAGEICLK